MSLLLNNVLFGAVLEICSSLDVRKFFLKLGNKEKKVIASPFNMLERYFSKFNVNLNYLVTFFKCRSTPHI